MSDTQFEIEGCVITIDNTVPDFKFRHFPARNSDLTQSVWGFTINEMSGESVSIFASFGASGSKIAVNEDTYRTLARVHAHR